MAKRIALPSRCSASSRRRWRIRVERRTGPRLAADADADRRDRQVPRCLRGQRADGVGERLARNREPPRGQGAAGRQPRGASWRSMRPPGALGLQFRDINFVRRRHGGATLSPSGPRRRFRMYRTENGGQTWTLTFRTPSDRLLRLHGVLRQHRGLGAASTRSTAASGSWPRRDGGRSWQISVNADMPPALPATFAFAASGQCLTRLRVDGMRGSEDGWRRQSRGCSTLATATHLDSREHTDSERSERKDLSACLPGSASPDRSRQRLCPRRRLAWTALALRTTTEPTWQLNQDTPNGLRTGATGSPVATSSSSGRR